MVEHGIHFVTLGCAKNEVDTDKMKAALQAAGYSFVNRCADAALVIVNTCSFLVSATEEGLDVIFDLIAELEEAGGAGKLLVAGCIPSRYGADLEEELSEVDAFVAAADEGSIVERVVELIGPAQKPDHSHAHAHAATRTQTGPSAYVKISDGCDRFCSYCMIPYIRGRYRSYPLDDILSEIAELAGSGVREVVLIGQDTGLWGRDLFGKPSLRDLLDAASSRFPDLWFRVLYVQPEGVSDELLDLMAQRDNICSYLDIPLQHVNADVLERMNRTGSAQSYLELVSRVRKRVEGVTLRTTLMAGFPGETEEQFAQLVDFVDEARFDYAVVFPYSQEDGSRAALFDGQIDETERIRRAQVLLDACDAAGHARARTRVGAAVEALVEGYERTDVGLEALCRTKGQAPDVDGQVHVPVRDANTLRVGQVVRVRLLDSFCYEFEGELV